MSELGWVALQTHFPERSKMGAGSAVGGGKYSKFGKSSDTVRPLHTLVLDTKCFYYVFQDNVTLKANAAEMVKKVEVKWTSKNKGRPPGSRYWPEERQVLYYYPPSPEEPGRVHGTFILLVASTWHFTHEVQFEPGQPKFNPNKVRIQVKVATRNFGNANMMIEGGAYIYYNDFASLLDSQEFSRFLDRLAERAETDKHPPMLQQLADMKTLFDSASFKADEAYLKSASLAAEKVSDIAPDDGKAKKAKKAQKKAKKAVESPVA